MTDRADLDQAVRNRDVADRAVPDVDELRALGLEAGLTAVGVTGVEPFTEVRASIDARVAAGHDAGMRFTFGKPEVSTQPARLLPDARALVVAALAYDHTTDHTAEPADTDAGPQARVAAYAWRDHYAVLRDGLQPIALRLRAEGWRTRIVVDDNALVDRAAAHRAGLGWWGKSANLLVPGIGPWVVLGALATDAPLDTRSEPVADACGACSRCLDGCPTGAIVEPGVVDARRCLSWLLQATGVFPREHRVALGDRIYGCDECQEVCPPGTRGAPTGAVTVRLGTGPRRSVHVLDLLALDDAALLAAAGRWYVPERDPRYLRRNLLVVLGNVGAPDDPANEAALRAHLGHADGLVRAHAAWAAARLGQMALLALLRDDTDPLVRDELAAWEPERGAR